MLDHVKDGVELCELHKMANFRRKVQALQVSALILHRGEPADQLPNSRTVDVVHVSQVQQNHFPLIVQQSADRFSQQITPVAKNDPAARIYPSNFPGISVRPVYRTFYPYPP